MFKPTVILGKNNNDLSHGINENIDPEANETGVVMCSLAQLDENFFLAHLFIFKLKCYLNSD